MPACRYVEEISSAAKRLAGVTSEVNLRKLITHKPLPCVNEAAHSGFETQMRHHHKSNLKHLISKRICYKERTFNQLYALHAHFSSVPHTCVLDNK